jgi:phage terminase small subunit
MPLLPNNRHERFCLGLAEGASVVQAYVSAGYKHDRGNASALHSKLHIQARLAELQSEAVKATKLTVEGLIGELEAARQQASNLKQLSAAVRAVEAKARISGLLVQKLEIGNPGDFNPKSETPEGIVKEWLETETKFLPELTAYYNFTDEDHAFLVARLTEVFDLMHRRKQEAQEARNNALMQSYRPTIPHRAIGNGKASPL